MPILIHKVFAYITHGHRLLVFRHADFPKAGIQVPAGTVQSNEHADHDKLLPALLKRLSMEQEARTNPLRGFQAATEQVGLRITFHELLVT